MYGSIGLGIVANADTGVQPDAFACTLRVIGMDETAFGAFKMMGSERICYTTKSEWTGSVEGRGVENY